MTSHAMSRFARRQLGWASAVLFSSACGGDVEVPAPGPPPNVLLISIDTLRPDHLGAYGYSRATSPRIDKLAAEGALFETAISSSSWTLPAHAALFTGLPDSVHGCFDSDRRLDESRVTLAEVFKDHGYRTVGFFAGPFLHPTFGLAQGFERYIDCSSYAERSKQVAMTDGSLDDPNIVNASHQDVTNPRVYEQFRRWLDLDQTGPFFMFVHLWDTHFDFIPPPPYDKMFDPAYSGEVDGVDFFHNPRINPRMAARDLEHVLALYDGEIAWTDQHVAMLLEDLDTRGMLDNTVVALVSDHGEEFFEHGRKGHRFTLFDEVIRIPMIFWFPKKIPAGIRINDAVSMIDVFPTLLDLAGSPAVDSSMGQSLIGHFDSNSATRAAAPRPDRLAISELNTLGKDLASFRGVDKKLLVDNRSGRASTYDLAIDPREGLPAPVGGGGSEWEKSLVADAKTLRAWMNERRVGMQTAPTSPALSEALVEQLELLGYLDSSSLAPNPVQEPVPSAAEKPSVDEELTFDRD